MLNQNKNKATPTIVQGKKIAEEILASLKKELFKLSQQNITPRLAIILVGYDQESLIYVREKQRKAREIGIDTILFHYQSDISQDQLIKKIRQLNRNPGISGILLQLPLPPSLDTDKIIASIAINKDVDGLRTSSPFPMPCVSAILEILSREKITLKGKKIVIVGIGRLVGRPLFQILQKKQLNVQLISSKDKHLSEITSEADILICASKNKNIIKKGMVKKGAVVIDAACNVTKEAAFCASCVTPQIGGVGPVTVALLLKNVIAAAGLDKC